MKRAVPWALAAFFAGLLAVSLLTRHSPEEPATTPSKRGNQASPSLEAKQPPVDNQPAPGKPPEEANVPKPPREAELLRRGMALLKRFPPRKRPPSRIEELKYKVTIKEPLTEDDRAYLEAYESWRYALDWLKMNRPEADEVKQIVSGAATLVAQLSVACELYKKDWGEYPPGDGRGSKGLAAHLQKKGPKGLPYFDFELGMLDKGGNILNPVHPDRRVPARIIQYRNNSVTHPQHYGPAVFNHFKVDIWCAGPAYDEKNPALWWAINNWE